MTNTIFMRLQPDIQKTRSPGLGGWVLLWVVVVVVVLIIGIDMETQNERRKHEVANVTWKQISPGDECTNMKNGKAE